MLSKKEIKNFQKEIWDFYKKFGRKMPWRGEKDPYKILVSEIMLQQTQVLRVIPKYKEFPNFKILAKARLQDVLRVWSGLGHNRRAKYISQIAQKVVTEHKGLIPKDILELEQLSGIGKATARSIAAFAWNEPVVFIETNIRRVFIYSFFKNKKKISDKDLIQLIEQTLPNKKIRDWYYALMDYGAFLKTKENPNRQSIHCARQSKFEGSNREVRGAIVKYLSKNSKATEKDLIQILGFTKERFERALQGLIGEGFIQQRKGVVFFIK